MFILRYNFADPELFNHYLSHRDRIVLAKSWRNSRDEGSQLVDWCKVPETTLISTNNHELPLIIPHKVIKTLQEKATTLSE
jgi:hypothetical protein